MNSTGTTFERFLKSTWIHLLILYFVTFFIYSNTYGVPFLFDDEGSIQLNNGVHGLNNFFYGNGYLFLPNRVFGYLTFALNYQFGELNVAGYHIVNLALHVINSFLVYCLVRQTFRTPFLKDSTISRQGSLYAFVVALLFACHPVQTQAVTYIVQRLTSLATLFFLATTVLYIRWRLARADGAPFRSRNVLPSYILSLVTAILAMKTKEIAFTLPMVVILYELSFFGLPDRRRIAELIPLALTAAIIPLTMFRIHKGAGDILSDVTSATVAASPLSRWEYLCTQFNVILTYLRLLVLPVNQNLDYDYPISHSLLEPRAFLSFLALLVLVATAVYLMYRSTRYVPPSAPEPLKFKSASSLIPLPSSGSFQPSARLIAFGIFWFFITLSVESSVIPITDVIFEHRVYLPSIGFFLALVILAVFAVDQLKSRIPHLEKIAGILLVIIALALSCATYARNNVWRDWLTIWGDTVSKSPDKARPHNILGIGYLYRKLYDAALPEFQAAVRLNPNYMEAWFNLGMVYRNMERYKESITMYQKALALSKVDPSIYAKIYCEIGVDYIMLGDFDQAIEAFRSAVTNDPEFVEYRNNYAHALLRKGLVDDAARETKTVLATDPGNQRALEMLRGLEPRK